ncbi:MAG: hypothetical protein HS104_20725 [Polyangiaceae bacterium]|nr:hypothetical protein [Polyangiaceae bacterium]MCE7891365.1 hypothetical protein [Sorangiineae bacterium PRO1]MCL4749629.1 hypothetical protein [Myxococcales bacterium]
MRIDRDAFLLLAASLFACHAEQRRAMDAEQTRPTAAEPSAPLPEPEPEPEPELAADTGGDAAAEPPVAAPDDAGNAAPPLPAPRSAAELRKLCAAMAPAKTADCPNERKQMCQTVLAEYAPLAATRAIECLASFEVPCDSCGVRTCVLGALQGLPVQKVAECSSVAKSAERTSEGYGQVMGELCERYASGMTARGRTRFIACLKKHLGAGVRICLWDPSVTPCTEKSGSVRSHDLVPTVE